jgi:hypothetical protein
MKVFIVFIGIFLINISFLSYQGDMGRYVRCQAFLKAVAEECAAGAALYYDEEAYSEGQLRFYSEEGRKYIEYILEESKKEMPLPPGSVIEYEAAFQDEGAEIPSVTVELTAVTEDLFRLPFLEITEIKRAARYELPQ